jgi:hypothetical protein
MISFENLMRAAHAATRGKRFKPGVARFLFDLERQLLGLHDELASKTYHPGPYRSFTIYEGKTRQSLQIHRHKSVVFPCDQGLRALHLPGWLPPALCSFFPVPSHSRALRISRFCTSLANVEDSSLLGLVP